MTQIFVGKDSLVSDVYPMHSSKHFVNTLEDNRRFREAMSKLLSDYAQVEISNKLMDILRMYHSSCWHSEPYHQNQNPSEWHYRTIKAWTNTILNRSGAPADCWLLCMSYVCCRILGLTTFNSSSSMCQWVVLSTECYRTRKLGYGNLNWPRCSARVTESLALTDGSFCQKQNTL